MRAVADRELRRASARRPNALDRLARAVALRRLARLDAGEIEIAQGGDTVRVGRVSPAEPRPRDERGEGDRRADPLRARVEIRGAAFWRRVVFGGALGAADAYEDGLWTSDDLAAVLRLFARSRAANAALEGGAARGANLLERALHALRGNSRAGSRRNIADHYDLGNDFFALFLDPTMTYSCGLFDAPGLSLEEAQRRKLDLVCRKLELSPEDHVLEIGSGWGGFALHAAGRHGCRVTTTTVSRAQFDEASRRVAAAGLGDRVEILLRDYRDLPALGERFSRLVSIEMIEAVGEKFLDRYLETIAALLAPGGRALLQAILIDDRLYARYRRGADFIQRRIFPGSFLPALGDLAERLARRTDLALAEVEDLTPHYPPTLRAWRAALAAHRSEALAAGYDERLLRRFDFYFAYCEAGFEERTTRDAQLLLARPGAGAALAPEARA